MQLEQAVPGFLQIAIIVFYLIPLKMCATMIRIIALPKTSFFHFIYLFHSLSHRHMWGWVIQVILTHTWFSTNQSLCTIIPLCLLSSVIIIYNILILPLQVLLGLIRILVSDP